MTAILAMQFFGLTRKFRISSKFRLQSLYGVVELRTSVHSLSTYNKQSETNLFSSPIVFCVTDCISSEVGRLTRACKWKCVIGVQHSAMLTSVSAGNAELSLPWKRPGVTLERSTLGRCITAPLGTSGFPNRNEFGCVAKTLGRQFCRFSSSVVQASAEVGQSEDDVDPKALKTSIYDSLKTERITVELFHELDFALEGNSYPKVVKLVARKMNVLFEEVGGEERVPALLKHLGMKLNPHIVAQVMKLQKNPSTVEHFFDWAGRQPEFQHNSHSYNLKFWNLIDKKNVGPGQ